MKVRMFDAKKSDVFDFRFPSLPSLLQKIVSKKKSSISYTKTFDFLCFLTVSDV